MLEKKKEREKNSETAPRTDAKADGDDLLYVKPTVQGA